MPSSRTLFNRFKKRLRPKGRQWRGVLAAVDGQIEVPGRPYHYYVRLERSGGRGESGIFPGTLVRPLENLPVLIEEDPRDGRQVIVDVDWATLAYAGDTDIPDPRLSRHRETHEFGGDDMLAWLSFRQIYELRVQPGSVSGHVSVMAGPYVLDGQVYVNSDAIDVDLTSYQPSSGTAWVLLSIDDGYGVNISSAEASPEDLDKVPVDEFGLGAVRLRSSAAITWDDILPLRVTGGERRYTGEEAVDAVANALLDTATVAWTYNDPTGEIEADVALKPGGSLDSDSSGIFAKIASDAEIETGEDAEKLITPAGLNSLLGTFNASENIPEYILEFTEVATLGIGAKYFYLPRGHAYRSGLTPSRISEVLVASVDKTANQGTVWQEVPRDTTGLAWSKWPGNEMAGADTTYGDGTCDLFTWAIYRYTTTASEVWSITWQERRIINNPLRFRECVMSNSSTLSIATAEWANQRRYNNGTLAELRNTNGVLISGVPSGYKVFLWGGPIKTKVRSRGRHWRPLTIMAPAAGESYVAVYAGSVGSNRLLGASLYNPTTYAHSDVKVIGYVVNSASVVLLRVLK